MKSNKPFHVRLSHYPHDTTFLHVGSATSDDACDICQTAIATGATYYYYDVGTHDTLPVIGIECYHKFHPMSHQKPYWITMPTQGATQDIRTTDDAGWREYIDGIWDEWQEIFSTDLIIE